MSQAVLHFALIPDPNTYGQTRDRAGTQSRRCMQIHLALNLSITIPGHPEPVHIKQWVPVDVPTPNPPEAVTVTTPATATRDAGAAAANSAINRDMADTISAKPAPASATLTRPRLVLAAHGSKFAATTIESDGILTEVPACVAQVLREIGSGSTKVRFRHETRDKLQAALPWVLKLLKPDPTAKVIARKHQYVVAPDLPAMIELKE